MIKKLVSFSLILVMMLSLSVVAFAEDPPGERELTGDGITIDLDTEVYSFTFPTGETLDFIVDPKGLLGVAEDGSSLGDLKPGLVVGKGPVLLLNKSSVDVNVKLEISATQTAGSKAVEATFVTSKTAAYSDDTDNNIALYIAPAKAALLDVATYERSGKGYTFGIETGPDPLVPGNTLNFILKAADYLVTPDTEPNAYKMAYVEGTGDGTAFEIGGWVNPDADWSEFAAATATGTETTIGLEAVFTVSKNTDDSPAYIDGVYGLLSGATNDVSPELPDMEPPAPAFTETGFIVGNETLTTAATEGNTSNKADLDIPFFVADGEAITKVEWNTGGSTNTLTADTHYAYDAGTNKFTLKTAWTKFATATGARNLTITVSGTAYVYTISNIIN